MLVAEWEEDNPTSGVILFSLDEFDPRALPATGGYSTSQICIKGLKDTQTWITSQLYQVEQEALIVLHLRPINYTKTTIDASKVQFENIKSEVIRILSTDTIDNVSQIEYSGWKDEPIGRGLDTEVIKKPIVFKTTLVVKITYFLDGGSVGGSPPSNGGGPSFLLMNDYDYIVFYSSYYTAVNSHGIITYGGQDDAGGVVGTSAASVIQACISSLPTGGIVFLHDQVTTPTSLLMKDNVRLVSKSVLGSGGTIVPTIIYTGTDYAIREYDEVAWKNFGLKDLAISNTNSGAKGMIRLGKCDCADLSGIALTGYATEWAINIPYSSLKGNTKSLVNIRIEGDLHIAGGIDCQADWSWLDGIIISKTTGVGIRVGDQTKAEPPYECHSNNVHFYDCQGRALDIEWAYYFLGSQMIDEHTTNFVGTKECSWYQAAGKVGKVNVLSNCQAFYNVGAGHPPSPYVELIDNQDNLVTTRSDSPAWGDSSLGFKVTPRLIVDDLGRGSPDVVSISTTSTDVIRMRKYGHKDLIFAINPNYFQIWDVTDSLALLRIDWDGYFCQHIHPAEDNKYSIGKDGYRWAFVRAYSTKFNLLNVLSGVNQGVDSNLIPLTDNARDLGSIDKKWANMYIQSLKISESFLPDIDDTVSLGNDNYRWSFIRGNFGKFDDLSIIGDIGCDGILNVASLMIGGTQVIDTARAISGSSYKIGDVEVISAARLIHNVDLSASMLSEGTVPDARLSGATENVTVAKDGGGTITLQFVNGLYKGKW